MNALLSKVVVSNGAKKTSLNASDMANVVLPFQEEIANFAFNGTVPNHNAVVLNGPLSLTRLAERSPRSALNSNNSEEELASKLHPSAQDGSRTPELFKRRFARPRPLFA